MGSSPSSHDVNAECAERIAVVIQNSILSSQSPFVVKVEGVLRTHFARHGAQVYQLTFATDAACLQSTQECQCALGPWAQTTVYVSVQSAATSRAPLRVSSPATENASETGSRDLPGTIAPE